MNTKETTKAYLSKLSKSELINEILDLVEQNIDVEKYYSMKLDKSHETEYIKQFNKKIKSYLKSDNRTNFDSLKETFKSLIISLEDKSKLSHAGLDLINKKTDNMFSDGDRRERSFDELYQLTELTLQTIQNEEDEIKAGFILEEVISTVSNIDNVLYEEISELISGHIDWDLVEEAKEG